jgi:hypothetical protein
MVVLVAGPPGSGKTTRARKLADDHGLTVYDRDDPQWSGEAEFRVALAEIGDDPDARAVVIRSCATRSAWHKVTAQIGATRTELLAVPDEVCRGRIAHDPRPYTGRTWKGPAQRLAGVAQWHKAHRADPWSPPVERLAPSRAWFFS